MIVTTTPSHVEMDQGSTQIRRDSTLAIVILNYRTPKLVLDCLATLVVQARSESAVQIMVVDNASPDGSADVIEEALKQRGWTDVVRLVRSPVNGGFAAGNNVGIQAIKADRYLLLNSDTLVREDAIRELRRAMCEHPDAGIVSPRLEWPDGEPQRSCFNEIRPVHAFLRAACTGLIDRSFKHAEVAVPVRDEPFESDWTSFACVLIRREVFEQIGLLDDRYFMYYEDVDFCRRAREAGWKVLHWPKARVVHLRGGSGPVKKATAARKRRPRYFYASRARYYAKFYGRTGLWWANALATLGRGVSLLREFLRTKEPHMCRFETLDNWTNARRPLQVASLPDGSQ